jgi:hypothetical protein
MSWRQFASFVRPPATIQNDKELAQWHDLDRRHPYRHRQHTSESVLAWPSIFKTQLWRFEPTPSFRFSQPRPERSSLRVQFRQVKDSWDCILRDSHSGHSQEPTRNPPPSPRRQYVHFGIVFSNNVDVAHASSGPLSLVINMYLHTK